MGKTHRQALLVCVVFYGEGVSCGGGGGGGGVGVVVRIYLPGCRAATAIEGNVGSKAPLLRHPRARTERQKREREREQSSE
jgi:hypothetical protein